MSAARLALGVIVVAFTIGATTGPLLAVLVEGITGVRLPFSLCATVVPGLLMYRAHRNITPTQET